MRKQKNTEMREYIVTMKSKRANAKNLIEEKVQALNTYHALAMMIEKYGTRRNIISVKKNY